MAGRTLLRSVKNDYEIAYFYAGLAQKLGPKWGGALGNAPAPKSTPESPVLKGVWASERWRNAMERSGTLIATTSGGLGMKFIISCDRG